MPRKEIVVEVVLTADNADLLAGSDLESIPRGGVLTIYGASTQDDTTITVTGPNMQAVVRAMPLTLRAAAEIRQDSDVPFVVPVLRAGKYIVNIDVVTAATARVRAIYIGQ